MILEEAYSNNPKPDKQARLEIVQRVSLNEKEVQVRCRLYSLYIKLSRQHFVALASVYFFPFLDYAWKNLID
jgi:hypothetical protein